jgi:hypothetical protein
LKSTLHDVVRSKSVNNAKEKAPGINGDEPANSKKRRRSDVGEHRPNTPFQRVKEDEITYKDDRLRDNTFFSKGDTYGVKAHQDKEEAPESPRLHPQCQQCIVL